MFITISYSGVEEHITTIGEELRYLQLLRQAIIQYTSQDWAAAAASELQKCIGIIDRVQDSTKKRADLLRQLIDGMKSAEAANTNTIERLEYDLEREIWIERY